METKWVPENKTFLYIVVGLIIVLAGYKLYQLRPVAVEGTRQIPSVETVRNLLSREMGIRKRHEQLRQTIREWDACFLRGTPKEASLALLKSTEVWARETDLNYESTQMLVGTGDKEQHRVGLTIQGTADYRTVQRFLQRVESAPIAVSIVAIRLKSDDAEKKLRYELKLEAPLLESKGGIRDE